ncbi:hypothetical protein NST84_18040 [Paenibacillus sp. FSL R7-0345]|jgi:hypothetical protein|uniref:hypothetical protein n=1 Tax=Paenibacillus sp. FSL R7-0345 TaxID=2954535 RepID=UPI003159B4BC
MGWYIISERWHLLGGAAPAGGAEGLPPSSRPAGETGDGGGEQRGAGPQGGGQMSFTEETAVITVTSSTKLLSVSFTDGKRTEAALSLSSLKAGDVIQYTLKSGTAQADSISLRSGTPGAGQQ